MKEQVIVFEGEHLLVAPKKRISNKKKGIQIDIPEEMNVVAPVGTPMEAPIEPPKQPDEPIGSPKTTTTQEVDAAKPTTIPSDVTIASKNVLIPKEPSISLGGASRIQPVEEIVSAPIETTTSTTTSTTTLSPKVNLGIPLVPISFGAAPISGGGRVGGGGGGGSEEEQPPVEEKKTNYLWVVILGIAALIYFTKKKS